MTPKKEERERLFVPNDPHAMRISGELAAEIGLMPSIVLLQFEFLISVSTIQRDGKRWIKRTLEELREVYFSWSSRATIWRAIRELESRHLVYVRNFNQGGFDKTLWFALDMSGIRKLDSVRVFHSETASEFQSETQQVDEGSNHKNDVGLFQDETSTAQSEKSAVSDVSDRDFDVSDRDLDSRDLKPRSDQNETTIGKELRTGDLRTKSSSTSVADSDPLERPEISHLCSLLANLVSKNTGREVKATRRWGNACRLLLDRDGRDPLEAEKVMRWACDDEFWRANILSFPKFRQKFDTLRLQSERKVALNGNGRKPGFERGGRDHSDLRFAR